MGKSKKTKQKKGQSKTQGPKAQATRGSIQTDFKKGLRAQIDDCTYCDVRLFVTERHTVEQTELWVHKCVLGLVSPYFHKMFTADKHQHDIDVTETFQTGHMLHDIVNFMYGVRIDVTNSNVVELLRLGELLDIPDFINLCEEYLLRNLTINSCVQTWKITDFFALMPLCSMCEELVLSCFSNYLIEKDEILEIDHDSLLKLIDKGLTGFCTKEQIDIFLLRYIQHKDERADIKETLINAVALYYSSESHEKVIENKPRMVDNEEETQATEALFVLDNSKSKLFVYNADNYHWYSMLIETLKPNEELTTIGIGHHQTLALISAKQYSKIPNYILLNLVTGVKCTLPPVPLKGQETNAKSYQRICPTAFSLDKNLYLVYCSIISYHRNPHEGESCDILTVNLQKFDFEKWKWKFITELGAYVMNYDQDEANKCKFSLIYSENKSIYIFLVRNKCLSIFPFNASTGKATRTDARLTLGSYDFLQIWVNKRCIYGFFEENKKTTHRFNFDKSNNSVGIVRNKQADMHLPYRAGTTLAISHLREVSYVSYQSTNFNHITYFAEYGVEDRNIKQLPFLPFENSKTSQVSASVLVLSTEFFRNVPMENSIMNPLTPICSGQEVKKYFKSKKMKQPEGEEEDALVGSTSLRKPKGGKKKKK